MKYILLVLLAAQAAVCSLPLLPRNSKYCIDNCACKFGKLPNRLQIVKCNKPLVLNATTFRYINKAIINVVSLENLIINQIQENAFKDFHNLDDVIVLNTKIGSIDAKAFNNVTRLRFQNCGFEDSPDLFSEKLEEIHFGGCNLEEIPDLGGLLKLTFLNLTDNYLKNIEVEAFAELFELEELYLSNNEIFRLPATALINNRDLITLNLDNNPLKSFALNTSDSLETLSLKNCQLETFDEDSTRKLTSLNDLVLSHNNIRNINSKALSHMSELSVIDLSYNKLTNLDDNVFAENRKLIKITLDGNDLQRLPNFYLNNNEDFSLNTFSCKNCNLSALSSSVFENMEGMIYLELSQNKLKNVDSSFEKITSLKLLDISHNDIEYLAPQAFVKNSHLESLNIAGNPLISLNPEVFANNTDLRDIDARNASLERLWSNYNRKVPSLHKILLSGNQLSGLTEDDIKLMPKLEAIDLNHNPISFNLNTCKVIHQLKTNRVIPIQYTKEISNEYEKSFGEDIDGFSTIEWKDFHRGACPEYTTEAPTTTPPTTKSVPSKIETLDENDIDDDDDDEEDDDDSEYNDDDDRQYEYDEPEEETSSRLLKDDTTLARATYILSVTSVFVLSALVVLTIAVTITLCILRRNNKFEMQRANLPRLKIPLWNTVSGQKKHSGSVYRPLSEDLSGPKTPKLSRYEFTSTPVVHNA
ncbi:unnamed protein product [Phyllotreta striolata]|nr:unnamed protein product [Phyllotreta striolata]